MPLVLCSGHVSFNLKDLIDVSLLALEEECDHLWYILVEFLEGLPCDITAKP